MFDGIVDQMASGGATRDPRRRPATLHYRTLLARKVPRTHDGTDDPAPGVPTSLCARCTCPGL